MLRLCKLKSHGPRSLTWPSLYDSVFAIMTTEYAPPVRALDASNALLGLRPRLIEPPATGPFRAGPRRTRRMNPALPLFLAGTMTVTASVTGVAQPAEARPKAPSTKPPVTERGKTVREAWLEAKRAAQAAAAAAAAAVRHTLAPPATYTVVEGDSIADIAQRYGLSTASLLALNGLSWSTTLHAGQVLKLTHAGAIEPVVPEPPVVTAEQRHIVASGESIAAIAERYGVDPGVLLSVNGLGWSSIIYPGQVIVIPDPSATIEPVPFEAPAPVAEAAPSPAGAVGLSDEQWANAAIIVQAGRDLGVPDYGIVIALATAAQESSLRNLHWGDRDSLGLFQQRPSTGWGAPEELTDPYTAATRFYLGRSGYTAGLLDIPGWESMPLTVAAQAVQISAYPEAYAKWESAAWAWLSELG